jgi:hypothetical protein
MSEIPAVLGLRPHTYWTAAVVMAGPPEAPRVIERRRIVFAEGDERFVFHQAGELELAAGRALVGRVRASTLANAAREISRLLQELAASGVRAGAAVAPLGRQTPPDDLAQILRSHALMHAAEGHFYREVVADACASLGLAVDRPFEHQLMPLAGQVLCPDGPGLEERLRAMGAALGPPWGEDQKLAAVAAWLRLRASGG